MRGFFRQSAAGHAAEGRAHCVVFEFRWQFCVLKFMFSEKATKIEEIFTVHLTLYSKCQIDSEDFVNFCGLLRIYELYK